MWFNFSLYNIPQIRNIADYGKYGSEHNYYFCYHLHSLYQTLEARVVKDHPV